MELPPPGAHAPASVPTASIDPLSIEALTKTFDGRTALDGLTLRVPLGACYGLVGPNGSGKSTTMRAVVGLVRPDSGSISVCGIDVMRDVIGARRAMGVMLDPLELFERLSAWEFIETIGAVREMAGSVVRARAEELFGVLDLLDDADRPIAGYSHGMRKKTALAATLLPRPRLVLLDEPFEGVDPISTRAMRTMLDRFREGGGTVVLSTHVMDVVERVCDHVGVIVAGRILVSGPIDDLRAGRRLEDAFIAVVGGGDVSEHSLDWLAGRAR